MAKDDFELSHADKPAHPTGGIIVCVSGSIAAVAVPEILQLILRRKLARNISVALSHTSRAFVGEAALAVITGNRCIVDLTEEALSGHAAHVELARSADAAIVVPATANVIGKLANGIVDDTITTLLSVFTKTVVVVPAMHPATYRKAFMRRNIEQLRADDYFVLGPVIGNSMSERSRAVEVGAMPESHVIVGYLEHVLRFGVEPQEMGQIRSAP